MGQIDPFKLFSYARIDILKPMNKRVEFRLSCTCCHSVQANLTHCPNTLDTVGYANIIMLTGHVEAQKTRDEDGQVEHRVTRFRRPKPIPKFKLKTREPAGLMIRPMYSYNIIRPCLFNVIQFQ